MKPWPPLFWHSSIHHDDLDRLDTATNQRPQSKLPSRCAWIDCVCLHRTSHTNHWRPFPTRLAFSPAPFTATPITHRVSPTAILSVRNICPRFNTHLQFNDPDRNIFLAVQSNPSLANRRGCPHFVSDLYMVRRGARPKTLCFYVNREGLQADAAGIPVFFAETST